MPLTRISVSRVNFSPCYSLTWQKRGDSNNNTTSWYNRESMTTIVFIHIQSITKNIWVKVGHLSMISDCTPTPCAWPYTSYLINISDIWKSLHALQGLILSVTDIMDQSLSVMASFARRTTSLWQKRLLVITVTHNCYWFRRLTKRCK